jgi:hypothetical protein
MKLFHQLSEEEKNQAIHYCINLVVEDMIDDGAKVSPETEDEFDFHSKLSNAIVHAKGLATQEEQLKYLLEDDEISAMLHDFALGVAQTAFYHDTSELVIFPEHLNGEADVTNENTDEEDIDDVNQLSVSKIRDPKSMN